MGKKRCQFGKCIKDDLNTFGDDNGLGGFIFLFLNMHTNLFTDDIYTLHRCMCLLMYESEMPGGSSWMIPLCLAFRRSLLEAG